jgi:oligosaccharyltransferase complex subunit gamma
MRFIPLLIGFLLSAGISASARQDTNKFQQRPTPIELDDSSYDKITSTPRDYHVAILLTALDARYGCSQCRSFQSEWDLITHSWNKGIKPDGIKLAFGTLDFNNGRNTFQKVGANSGMGELSDL